MWRNSCYWWIHQSYTQWWCWTLYLQFGFRGLWWLYHVQYLLWTPHCFSVGQLFLCLPHSKCYHSTWECPSYRFNNLGQQRELLWRGIIYIYLSFLFWLILFGAVNWLRQINSHWRKTSLHFQLSWCAKQQPYFNVFHCLFWTARWKLYSLCVWYCWVLWREWYVKHNIICHYYLLYYKIIL